MNPKLIETISKYLLLPLIKEVGAFFYRKWQERKIRKEKEKREKANIVSAQSHRDSDETNTDTTFNNLP